MSTFPPTRRFSLKIIGIVFASIIVIGAIGYGTFTLLKKVKAPLPFTSSQSSQSQAATADQVRQQAEQLVKDHKLTEAKAAYQTAATAYAAEGNNTAALDAKQQIAVIETAIKAAGTQGQTPTPKAAGSANHYTK
jgi:hypothetical protein